MKTLILSLLFIIVSVTVHSTILVVDNSSGSGAPYTNLQTAIDAAVAGDTIYVSPSTTSYGDITINKKLVIIGSGRRPGAQIPGESEVRNINFTNTQPSGSYISGLRTSGIYGRDNILNNITFERNYIYSSIYLDEQNSDFKFIGNIIRGTFNNAQYATSLSTSASNTILQNNIFNGSVTGLNSTSLVFNNITFDEFKGVSTTIFNNIFLSSTTSNGVDLSNECTDCTYNNNLTWAPNSAGFAALINDGNEFGGNNLDNTDPQFVNVPLSTLGAYSFGNDYRLKDTSPGKNYGTDGTDLGVYGVNYNFVNNYHPDDVPRMLFMNVTNAVIQQGGSLNVDVEATSQN